MSERDTTLEWAHDKGEQDRSEGKYDNPHSLGGPFNDARQGEIAEAYDAGQKNTDDQISGKK